MAPCGMPTMTKRITGRYERTTLGGEEVAAFIPLALPPGGGRGGTLRQARAADCVLQPGHHWGQSELHDGLWKGQGGWRQGVV